MATSKTNPAVDRFVKSAKKWQPEVARLRAIFLTCPLTEELKWGKPCYTFQGSNVVVILPLKNHCALVFAKGALIQDAHGNLIQPSENTQAARQMRFTSLAEIVARETILKGYIKQAIEVEKSGQQIVYKKITDYRVPEELQQKLDKMPALKKAFAALTPGRQRAYFLHFAGAKQSATRVARVEKCIPRILKGKGMLDE
jgi:uncharacterized protein YdeI (YjbR/CyaY-like superfamily)